MCQNGNNSFREFGKGVILMIDYKVTSQELIAICWYLFDYEIYNLALLADLFGKEKAFKSVTATKMMMYSISANMILKGEY